MFFPHTGLFRLCGFLLRGIVMKYDFTSILERHGKDAIAVDGLGTGFAPSAPKEGFDAIPMWVADMNFATRHSATLTPATSTTTPSSSGRPGATA